MKLHLGCGKRDFGLDWMHIDGGHHPHVTSHDIVTLPFDDDSCSLIYASHVIEYFDRAMVVNVLKEWCRALRSGGTLRLAVPDFESMTKLYYANMMPLETFLGPLYGKMQPPGCKAIYHRTVYDFMSLKMVLQNAGLENVKRYDWRNTEHSHIDDHSQAYIPHMDKKCGTLVSLNVEGTKV